MMKLRVCSLKAFFNVIGLTFSSSSKSLYVKWAIYMGNFRVGKEVCSFQEILCLYSGLYLQALLSILLVDLEIQIFHSSFDRSIIFVHKQKVWKSLA